MVIALGAVVALLLIGGIGSALNPPKKSDAGNSVPISSTSPTASIAKRTPPPVKTSASSRHKTPVQRQTRPIKRKRAPVGPVASFAMPNELGKNLQSAQDDVQRVSQDPVFISHSHDLLGDRFQILDRDWQVCTQNIQPGTTVSAVGHIDFGVVKIYENCP